MGTLAMAARRSLVILACAAAFADALRLTPPSHASNVRASAAAIQMQAGRPEERIEKLVNSNTVMLFMKGNKMFPQCGFSNTAIQIMNAVDTPFETFDVLSDNEIRQGIKDYAGWPTIPQLYVEGEFIGGCDIMIEMYQSGELQEIIER